MCYSEYALFNYYYSSEQVKEDEMGETCGTHEGEKCIQVFGGGALRSKSTWKT